LSVNSGGEVQEYESEKKVYIEEYLAFKSKTLKEIKQKYKT